MNYLILLIGIFLVSSSVMIHEGALNNITIGRKHQTFLPVNAEIDKVSILPVSGSNVHVYLEIEYHFTVNTQTIRGRVIPPTRNLLINHVEPYIQTNYKDHIDLYYNPLDPSETIIKPFTLFDTYFGLVGYILLLFLGISVISFAIYLIYKKY